MIRITVEILPQGDVDQSRVLGMIYVSNVGTSPDDVGAYRVWDALAGEEIDRVIKHNRKRGWRPLVARAMAAVARYYR